MAAVATILKEVPLLFGVKLVLGTLAMDSSYPTDGEAVDLSDSFEGGVIHLLFGFGSGYIFDHDGGTPTAGKIKAWWFDYDAGADGAAIEVANTTDLSGITAAPFIAFGL